MTTVDTVTETLDHGESTSITLSWDTELGDEGDHTASAVSTVDTDTTSVSIETLTKRTTGRAPAATGQSTRTLAATRAALSTGDGTGRNVRTLTAGRSLAGDASAAAGITRRTLDAVRLAVGFGEATGRIERNTTLARSLSGRSPAEAASTTRAAGNIRSTAAGVAPSTIGAITGALDAARQTVGFGEGSGWVGRTAPLAFELSTDGTGDTVWLLQPETVETDHDQLTLSGQITAALSESNALDRYREAGDVDRVPTAFGAFRRIPRDGTEPLRITPPPALRPPFAERRVVPVNSSIEQITPTRYDISLYLGLEEPRPREPLEMDSDPETIGTESLTLEAGETISTTISGTAPSTEGTYLASVHSKFDSDTTVVTVSDADWLFEFPVDSLPLSNRQVGQIDRRSNVGRSPITIPLRLTPEQAAILVAVGSRVEAVADRTAPDAQNRAVDTLPSEELTATVSVPEESPLSFDGDVLLREWSLSWERPKRHAIDATITVLALD